MQLIEHATQLQFIYVDRFIARRSRDLGQSVHDASRSTYYDEAKHRWDLRRATVQGLAPAVQDFATGARHGGGVMRFHRRPVGPAPFGVQAG